MGPRELRATVERIPPIIKKAIPVDQCKAMLDGEVPNKGFGIGGAITGGGKTCALAAIFLACLKAYGIKNTWPGNTTSLKFETIRSPWLKWVYWPEAVVWMRFHGTSDELPDFINRIIKADVLVLDDLGCERIKGSYVEDFAASQLDMVVDTRYREELPTFYTTNLSLEEMINFYGARLVSRLCGDNPFCYVSGLTDQRAPR